MRVKLFSVKKNIIYLSPISPIFGPSFLAQLFIRDLFFPEQTSPPP